MNGVTADRFRIQLTDGAFSRLCGVVAPISVRKSSTAFFKDIATMCPLLMNSLPARRKRVFPCVQHNFTGFSAEKDGSVSWLRSETCCADLKHDSPDASRLCTASGLVMVNVLLLIFSPSLYKNLAQSKQILLLALKNFEIWLKMKNFALRLPKRKQVAT